MRTRILLRFVLVVIPTVGLLLLWLAFLPHQGQAALSAAAIPPAQERSTTAQQPTPTPDPTWVQLVRAPGPGVGDAPAASMPTINLNLTGGIVAGRVASGTPVEVAITSQGQLIASQSVLPVPDGASFFYLAYFGSYDNQFSAGNELQVTQGAAAISMTVPALTSLAYPQMDILSGTAPASAALLAYLFPYADPDLMYTATVTAGGDGVYQLAWAPAVDLKPVDSGYLFYIQDPARQTSIRFTAPLLRAQAGGWGLSGAAAPLSTVDIVVEDAAGMPILDYYAYAGLDGFFDTSFTCGGGGGGGGVAGEGSFDDFTFLPGYRVFAVAGGQTFSMTLIALTAHADRQAGLVWGETLPDQPVEVQRFSGPVREYGDCLWQQTPLSRETVTATAGGGYTAALPLDAGNYGSALVSTPDGNQVYARFVVPYLFATLGKSTESYLGMEHIRGQVDEPFVPITVEIQGPSGYLKDWYTIWASDNGYFSDYNYSISDVALESGDRLTLTTPGGSIIALLLPTLTAEADPSTDLVTGQAPPGARLVLTLDYLNAQLVVTATAEGLYTADFTSLGGFSFTGGGKVVWTSAEGYHVARRFSVDPFSQCPQRLYSAQIGGNMVSFTGSYRCEEFTFRLRSADGHVKIEMDLWGNPDIHLYDQDRNPVPILTGDQLELEAGGQVETAVVPALTVNINPQSEQVYGQAPPAALIELGPQWGIPVLTTTASAQGAYAFDLAGWVDLDAGSSIRVGLHDGLFYYAFGVLPEWNITLFNSEISGWLPPLTYYSVTLYPTSEITPPHAAGYADGLGYFQNRLYGGDVYPPPATWPVSPGDRIEMKTADGFWQVVLPWLTAQVDASTGVLSGQAPPTSRLSISLDSWTGPAYSDTITTTANGTYSVGLPVPVDSNFISGHITHFTTDVIRTLLFFNTPRWDVTLWSSYVSGFASMAGSPITLTLQSGDGAFSQVVTSTTWVNDSSFWVQFQREVHPGDHLSLETVVGEVHEFTVPRLTAVHDFARRALEGQAPTDGDLIAYIPSDGGTSYRHVRLAADGHYGVDTSDLDTRVGGQGRVTFTDRFGNKTSRLFTIRGYLWYLPVIRLLAAFP